MSLYIATRRMVQPGAGTVARGEPFASRLSLLFNGAEGFLTRNLIKGERAVLGAGGTATVSAATPLGIGLTADSTNYPAYTGKQYVTGTSYTILVAANPANTSAIRPLYVQRPPAGGTNCSLMANFDPSFSASAGRLGLGIDATNGFYADGAITGKMEVYGIAVDGTTARMYRSGLPMTTTTVGAPGSPFDAGQTTYLGAHQGSGTYLGGQIAGGAVFDGVALPDNLMRRYTANLWQLFAPLPRRVWGPAVVVPPAVGSLGEFDPGLRIAGWF